MKTLIQLTSTQQEIVFLHKQYKEMRKFTHAESDGIELKNKIFKLRRQLIAELYPKG